MDSVSTRAVLHALFRVSIILALLPATTERYFPFHVLTSIVVSALAFLSLSSAATEKWISVNSSTTKEDKRKAVVSSSTLFRTRALGILAGTHLLAVACICPSDDPLRHVAIRVLAFFNAAKVLDMAVARAADPPMRLENGVPIKVEGLKRRTEYIWLLASETRYHSFDIAIHEPGRKAPRDKLWTYGPLAVVPVAIYFFPRCVGLYVFLGLLVIQMSLELTHTIMHPGCEHPLFWQPLSARSFGEFWRVHWHSSAASFLYTLGYKPVRAVASDYFGKDVSKAGGVLGAFCVSGIWHGWAAAALSTTPWRTGTLAWAMFMGHGIAVVVENLLPKADGPSWAKRIFGWTIALWVAGLWIKDAMPRSNLPLMVRLGEILEG
ncbi:Hypothetical predicted protein [Lecanosticta acicola]|uniref:Wax synthase domain-containing protein n=1 Tax=Lecanosticta acicola TaxID=111012 RepID=A0AAI8Z0V5_9PEZI|nr:Hypothetical predicted protein [Lecanosticta acicola]